MNIKIGDTVKVKLTRKLNNVWIEEGKVIKIEKDSIIVKHDWSLTPSRVSMKNIIKEEVDVKVGDKLTFNYGAYFPLKVGTVRSIVPSKYSKGGAFADVVISKETDDIGNSFSEITTADIGDIRLPGETSVNGSPIGVYLGEI